MKSYVSNRGLTVKEAYELGRGWVVEIAECAANYRGSAVYVLEFDNGIKIGMAKNLVNRLKNYRSPWTRKIMRGAYFKSLAPNILEKFLKTKFKHFTEEGSTEFLYQITFEEIVNFIKNNKQFVYKT